MWKISDIQYMASTFDYSIILLISTYHGLRSAFNEKESIKAVDVIERWHIAKAIVNVIYETIMCLNN